MQTSQNQAERVAIELRQMIMAGEFPPGSRMAEIPIAERLGVSRTPVRLALGVLEREGLLVGLPRRGFAVKRVYVKEILQGLAVQGVLEGMACASVASRGLPKSTRIELELCIEEGDQLVAKRAIEEGDATRWAEMNSCFHAAIVAAAANAPLSEAIEHNARLPFVGARALAFAVDTLDLSFRRMQSAQAEHRDLLGALKSGESARVEWLMREHARKSAEALREKLEIARSADALNAMPGLRLVVG